MPSKTQGSKVLSVVLLIMLSMLILSACMSKTAAPAQTPQPTEPPEEGQTITLITPDARNMDAENNPKYQIQTRLTDFQLLSESEGLAWGVTKNELRMYITKDNGTTWANISPSANVQFPSNPVYGKEIFFTDPSNGWIIRSAYGMTETIVLRTKDGGQSWKVSSLPDANPISSMYFYSPTHGWLLTSWDTTAIKESKALYSTVDGGATWKNVMQNEQYNPKLPNPAIPMAGVTTGMIFRDSMHGFVTLQTGALPKIYTTNDGGKTWQQGAPFLINERFEGCDRVITGRPEFFGGGRTTGWMSVGCQKDKDNSITYNGYFTANGGESWKFRTFGFKSRTGGNRHLSPTFLNLSTGWILDGSMLYQTQDQGATWTALKSSSVLEDKLLEYPEIVKLQFFSSEVGWLLIEKKEDKRSILLQTTNGGASWRVL
ncbi:YCF48-related protein [Bacillus sp. FJAT-27264]|uniref:WD40/YVTN/BNR-like repeat-containing protein n=1 Tax=Paenibacillus sp. (strain DSM 101736 / FJAT-27264) TaxID=1850362 RepID=UPI0009F3BC76|nr:YCF48-related protein [Bacillus sp. FJAT-27264]